MAANLTTINTTWNDVTQVGETPVTYSIKRVEPDKVQYLSKGEANITIQAQPSLELGLNFASNNRKTDRVTAKGGLPLERTDALSSIVKVENVARFDVDLIIPLIITIEEKESLLARFLSTVNSAEFRDMVLLRNPVSQ